MPEHKVPKNGVIYIIPNDELFEKLQNGEAFIDEYGRLMNKKPHRVLKELKHIGDQRPIVQRPVVVVQQEEEHPIRDAIRETIADELSYQLHRWIDRLCDGGAQYLLREKIVPKVSALKEYKKNGYKTKAELRIDQVEAKKKASSTQIIENPKTEEQPKVAMTEEEILAEQQKAVLLYFELMKSLTKLHNAGVIDKNSTLEQLTSHAAIEQFNQALAKNPNLLEMTQSNELSRILGRDLFQRGEYVPIAIEEIEKIAEDATQED